MIHQKDIVLFGSEKVYHDSYSVLEVLGSWGGLNPPSRTLPVHFETPLLDFNGYPVGGGGGGSDHASCLAKTHLSPVNTLPVSSGQTSIFIITSTLADLWASFTKCFTKERVWRYYIERLVQMEFGGRVKESNE